MEATSQTAPATVPTSSAQPTNYVPSAGTPSVTSQPQGYQASPAQVSPQVPAYQAPAQAPQVSAPQGNPWQQAFQALSASLNTSNPSQAQVSPSAYQTTPTPQGTTQPSWASQVPQVQPISQPQPSTQVYSESEVASLLQQAQSQASDQYLSGISDESLEVLEHFGAEAPALLNQYACAVEDALIEQVQRANDTVHLLEAAGEERNAMNVMLTDPDVLADYVNEFFGPEGPYPTETAEETAAREQMEARQQFEQEIEAQEMNNVPQNFQRPQMDIPTPGRHAGEAQDFWGSFSEMMDSSPENAWRYLSQAPQGALQAKALIQDN